MNDDRQFERSARTWLEIGPTDPPGHVVESALLAIATTSQERDLRLPWRVPRMTTSLRFVTAAVIGVLAIGGFLLFRGTSPQVGTPSPSPSTLASPKPTRLAVANYAELKGWIVFESIGRPDGVVDPGDFWKHTRQIWAVKADGSGLHALVPGHSAGVETAPDISPDGRTVIFASLNGTIWEAPITGGVPTLVSTGCAGFGGGGTCNDSDPTYSSDGTRMAFVRTETISGVTSKVIAIDAVGTGTVNMIESTRLSLDFYQDISQPTWSPDGSEIAFERTIRRGTTGPLAQRIVIVKTDGSALRELPVPAGDPRASSPDWSSDGSMIVFSTATLDTNQEPDPIPTSPAGIYTIHPDGTQLTRVCSVCLLGAVYPTWTPDGSQILFSSASSWALIDPDGGGLGFVNQKALTFPGSAVAGNPASPGSFALLQPTQ